MSFDLFQFMPAVYRLRDNQLAQLTNLLTTAEQAELAILLAIANPNAQQQAQIAALLAKQARGPLESLLLLIGEQLEAVEYDIAQLYDDQFIETCADWVIPYIGDLIGYQSITGIAPSVDNPRAEVANTISLRRRKGTVLVLEQLARDVTAWGAHAVEMFRFLGDTQYINHIRPHNFYAPDFRNWETGLYIDTAFDRTSHRVDVRNIGDRRGRYNIPNIGIFLWTLNTYAITNATPAAATAQPQGYRFNPLGMDIPLFHAAISQGETIQEPAQPQNVPDRLRRIVLCNDLDKGIGAAYYGSSLSVTLNGQLLNPYQIQIANLSGADGAWANMPPSGSAYAVAIDPELGRLALPAGTTDATLEVSYNYGFNAPIGGGPYPRDANFTVTSAAQIISVPSGVSNLPDALIQALALLPNGPAAIEISGDATITLSAPFAIDLPQGATLELRAAEGSTPILLLDGEISVTGAPLSACIINGLLIAAGPAMTPASPSPASLVHVPTERPSGAVNQLQQLTLLDCTLVPGWSVGPTGTPISPGAPTLLVEAPDVTIEAERVILGTLYAAPLTTIELQDCIIDATARTLVAYAAPDGASGGGALNAKGCTIIGKVHASLLTLVSDSIIAAALTQGDSWTTGLVADRKQEGCVRFSFLPVKPVIPRHYECVEQALAGPQPLFFSERYGNPAYLKMFVSTDDKIRRGASDGGEMGVYHFVKAPLREDDLNIRLQEYLPVGLITGLINQT
jgi:hypothetical protein